MASTELHIQYDLLLPIDVLTMFAITSLSSYNLLLRTCKLLRNHLTPLKDIIIKASSIKINEKITSDDINSQRVAQYIVLQNGKKHGPYREYQYIKKEKIVAVQGNYHGDKRVGKWFYAILPKLYIVKHFVDDKLEGDTWLIRTRHPKLRLYRRNYLNDQIHGSEIDYDIPNLTIKGISCHRHGVLHGACYVYDSGGDLSNYLVTYYDNGLIKERCRYCNGKLTAYELYNAGRLVWGLDHWLPDGTKVTYTRIGNFTKGYTILINHISRDGVLIHQARFVNGLAHYYDIKVCKVNDITRTIRTPYKRGMINGVVITRSHKELISIAHYKNNKLHGVSITYVKGVPMVYIYYDNDIRVREELRYETGIIREATDYIITEKGETKTTNIFYPNGNTCSTRVYINGELILMQSWDEDGNVIKSTTRVTNNVLQLEA